MEDFFKRRVADPIGIEDWDWGDYAMVDGKVINGGSGSGGKAKDEVWNGFLEKVAESLK